MKLTTFASIAAIAWATTGVEANQNLGADHEQVYCLAQNIYFESRNESNLGQQSVAWVTMNRVDDSRFPDQICDVVWQDRQFSWTHDGRSDTPREAEAWQIAQFNAMYVLHNREDKMDPTEGSTHYHATYVSPNWARDLDRIVRIDEHIFYRW